MEIWAIIIILILVVIFGVMIGLTYWTEYTNSKSQQKNIIYPFSGFIDPSQTNKPVRLTRAPGNQPQISCPVGTKVNIIGAWVEVNDPFGECAMPGSTFRTTCGDDSDRASAVSCSSSVDCGEGMDCDQGKCMPKSCSSAGDCGATACGVDPGTACKNDSDCKGGAMVCVGNQCQVRPDLGSCTFCRNGKCAQAPTCSNLNQKYQNKTCVSTNTKTNCRPRDASAYLAAACDGKQVCDVSWDPSSPHFFGPLPCQVSPDNVEYSTLPVIPGWSGGTPYDGAQGNENVSYKQGYYIHGIYTCTSD